MKNKLDTEAINQDFKEKLQIAANGNFAYLTPNLFQLLDYRQKIAQLLLSNTTGDEITLKSELDCVNHNIKKLIGL